MKDKIINFIEIRAPEIMLTSQLINLILLIFILCSNAYTHYRINKIQRDLEHVVVMMEEGTPE
jgi:hypothetical protein